MGVIDNYFLGSKTPVCDDCGIRLCWDISNEEYEENIIFWNNWVCEDCNPKYKLSRLK